MFTKIEEIKNQYKDQPDDVIDLIWIFLNVNSEDQALMLKVINRMGEDPHCLDFMDDWKGSAEDLRAALAQI